ncbi:MAG: tetratricopeptide repeat protein [Bdellovibrionota bacterium]
MFSDKKLSILSEIKASNLAFICAALAFLIYLPTIFYDFSYDDFHQIHNNTLVTSPELSLDTLLFPFFEPTFPGDVYRPLTVLSYRLTYMLIGLQPAVFHFFNVLLHSLITFLVFLLSFKTLKHKELAFFSATWFAVHPIHVEAVASVVGRAELLAAFFGLCSIFVFSKFLTQRTSLLRVTLLLASSTLLLLGTLSKESCLTLLPLTPIIALLMIEKTMYGYESRIRRSVLASIAIILTAIVYLFIRQTILNDLFLPDTTQGSFWVENPLIKTPLLERIVPGIILLGRYLELLILPIRLTADYSATYLDFWTAIKSNSGILSLVIASCFLSSLYYLRNNRYSIFGVWVFLTISIVLNIAFPIGTLFAERLAYLPSIGFCIFAVFLLANFLIKHPSKNRFLIPLLSIIILLSAFRTVIRIPVWENNESLFMTTLSDSPNSPKAKINLALQRYNQKRYQEAAQLFQTAILEDPERIFPYPYLINSLLFTGNMLEAELWCKRALQVSPEDKKIAKALHRIIEYKTNLRSVE